jgi:hypothetical protein
MSLLVTSSVETSERAVFGAGVCELDIYRSGRLSTAVSEASNEGAESESPPVHGFVCSFLQEIDRKSIAPSIFNPLFLDNGARCCLLR